MKLRVQYTGQLRTTVGRSEDELELAEPTRLPVALRELVSHLGEQARPHLTTAEGGLASGLLVVVNGSAVCGSQAHETLLKPGDVVTLLPPIAGG